MPTPSASDVQPRDAAALSAGKVTRSNHSPAGTFPGPPRDDSVGGGGRHGGSSGASIIRLGFFHCPTGLFPALQNRLVLLDPGRRRGAPRPPASAPTLPTQRLIDPSRLSVHTPSVPQTPCPSFCHPSVSPAWRPRRPHEHTCAQMRAWAAVDTHVLAHTVNSCAQRDTVLERTHTHTHTHTRRPLTCPHARTQTPDMNVCTHTFIHRTPQPPPSI